MTLIKLRPHHLICNLCFRGKGYNEEFITNFKSIHKQLKTKTNIKIINSCDDICAKCPEKLNNQCINEEKVNKIDNAYLNLLQIKIDEIISTECIETKIKELLTIDGFKKACHKCSWYHLNICEPIVRDLFHSQ